MCALDRTESITRKLFTSDDKFERKEDFLQYLLDQQKRNRMNDILQATGVKPAIMI